MNFFTKYGNYQLALKSYGGTKGKTYKTIVETNVDLLFGITKELSMYLIPIKKIKNKSTLTLSTKYEKFKIF